MVRGFPISSALLLLQLMFICTWFVDGQNQYAEFIAQNFMSPEAITAIKNFKIATAARKGISLERNKISPFLDNDQLLDTHTALRLNTLSSRRKKRKALNFTFEVNKKWDTSISYSLLELSEPDLNVKKVTIRQAFEVFQRHTNLKFHEIFNVNSLPSSYIKFIPGSACESFIGRNSDRADTVIILTDNCAKQVGQVINYIGATLGLFHEQQRPDRDAYVTVHLNQVQQEHQADFALLSAPLLDTYQLPYDFASVRHTPSKEFSATGQNTVTTKDALYQNTIGQRVELSFLDAKILNLMYKDQNVCSGTTAPECVEKYGYQDPNDCSKCKCPDGLAGTRCNELATHNANRCGTQLHIIDQSDGFIYSPGYFNPQSYLTGDFCTWKIVAPRGGRIRVRFVEDFGIYCEPAQSTCYHWVEIRYRNSMMSTGPRFCCTNPTRDWLESDSSEVMVIFKTVYEEAPLNSLRGFRLQYQTFDAPVCASKQCQNNAVCIDSTCICRSGTQGPLCEQVISTKNPSCGEPTFSRAEDVSSLGGLRVHELLTIDACLDFCANYDSCDGVDVNTNYVPVQCWILTKSNLMNKYRNPGIVQYEVINKCPMSSVSTTSTVTTTASVSQSTTTFAGSSVSVSETPTPTTTTTTVSTTAPAGCVNKWNEHKNVHAMYGTQIPGITSLEKCQEECLLNSRCVALDFNWYIRECWLHHDRQNIQVKYFHQFVTHYELVQRCETTTPIPTSFPTAGPGCKPQWNFKRDSNSVGAYQITGITTADDCQQRCIQNAACVAVDVVRTTVPVKCWIHERADNLIKIYYSPGTDQYQLTIRCTTFDPESSTKKTTTTTTPTTTTLTSTTTSTTTTTTTSPFISSTIFTTRGGGCQPEFSKWTQKNSINGIRIGQCHSETQCLEYCAANEMCEAVDVDHSSYPISCWAHFNAKDLTSVYYSPATDQYRVQKRCDITQPKFGHCGGCRGGPGTIQTPCAVEEVPYRTCQRIKTEIVTTHTGWGWHKKVLRTYLETYPCYAEFCCTGSEMAKFGGESDNKCAIVGWTAWSACGGNCVQYRYHYGIVTIYTGGQYITEYRVTSTESRKCDLC